MSIVHLKLQISEKFRKAKKTWHDDPNLHGTEEIPLPSPKKSCLDKMQNSLARTAVQIRTGHWRCAVYLKRIRKMVDDKCWLCQGSARMTRSHVLLHCPNERLRGGVGREEPWSRSGAVSQSQVGAAVCKVPGAIGSGQSGS
jgi:hypothetical protein